VDVAAAYVPYIGDGDVAAELYAGARIYGVDLDAARCETARARLPGAEVVQGDCEASYPFAGRDEPVQVGDFDAWSYPYEAFRRWWTAGSRAERVLAVFTDSQMVYYRVSKRCVLPSGEHLFTEDLSERRGVFNFYRTRVLEPWLREAVAPWVVEVVLAYRRSMMWYWGAVLARGGASAARARSRRATRSAGRRVPRNTARSGRVRERAGRAGP